MPCNLAIKSLNEGSDDGDLFARLPRAAAAVLRASHRLPLSDPTLLATPQAEKATLRAPPIQLTQASIYIATLYY